jgi:hypothetical protein
MTMKRIARIAGALAVVMLAPAVTPPVSAQGRTPANGMEVLERMRKRYEGKWYRTLTFSQKTTMAGRNGGAPQEETWHESLLFREPAGGMLRIDNGDPALGNGSVSSADSTWIVRAGKLSDSHGSGNPFIPLIENVYLQPASLTAKQIEPLKFDMSRVVDGTWRGRPVWMVGASSASDTTSPQFWIDTDRLVLVRMLLAIAANRPPFDIQLDNLVETGGGWLATKVVMYSGGAPRQTEEYYDWKTKGKLDPKLFDPATWSTAEHWVKKP